jgi:diguanylate cyclase (GGDEF)-like protein
LSGSGKTYGFPQVTEIGLWGEQDCDVLLQQEQPAKPEHLARWRGLLEELRKQFRGKAPADMGPDATMVSQARPYDIIVVDDDPDICRIVQTVLAQEGMAARIATSQAEAVAAIEHSLPDGMVIDVRLPDGSGYQVVENLRKMAGGEGPAVLMISALSSFTDKVESISSGADGYYEKPVDWEVLIQRLHYLLERNKTEAPRILSVEDDVDQAAFLRVVLESAGYEVRICPDPKHFEVDLVSFRPDLVIMDVVLPEVTGFDLVRYLRQHEQYATLPVLFLTMQGQMKDKIETVKAGGDDHLVKPVAPGLLLSTVSARIERARFLKSLLERDGLTKLLTHTAFLERAKVVVAAKSRNLSRSSVLVLLDLDHFKSVNDTYGHTTGDRVLASLSALLRRRLRGTDTIGRYGGEEFAILIEDLKQDEAVRLLNRLLDEFAGMDHVAPDGTVFHVTFSAGIAVLDRKMTLSQWLEAADRALYAAKAEGRRRIKADSGPLTVQ